MLRTACYNRQIVQRTQHYYSTQKQSNIKTNEAVSYGSINLRVAINLALKVKGQMSLLQFAIRTASIYDQ